MGKKAKEHRKKIEKRNQEIKKLQKKAQDQHKEMLMKLIEREKNSGMFNSPIMPLGGPLTGPIPLDGPSIGSIPSGPGPQI